MARKSWLLLLLLPAGSPGADYTTWRHVDIKRWVKFVGPHVHVDEVQADARGGHISLTAQTMSSAP